MPAASLNNLRYLTIVGLTAGTIAVNLFNLFGILYMGEGTLAGLLATSIAWKIGKQHFYGSQFIATWVETVIITSIVGSYPPSFHVNAICDSTRDSYARGRHNKFGSLHKCYASC